MKEIAPNLYIVTGAVAFSVPVFVFEVNENELLMIDTGLRKDARSIIKKIRTKWGSLEKIKKIVITHRHIDHIGGLRYIMDKIEEANKQANVEIICHEDEAKYLIEDIKVQDLKPTRTIKHEEYITKGVKAIHNPGHTFGHICILFEDEKLLLIGDTIMNTSGVLMPVFKKFHDDYKQYTKTLKVLLEYEWDYAIPSHNRPTKITREKIEKFIKKTAK